MSKQEWAEHAAAKVEAAQAILAEQVAALQSGDDWKAFLGFQAKLHQYSTPNISLIVAQHTRAYVDRLVDTPEPTFVAGFKTWEALGRSVNKGQHGYAVLAPITARRLPTEEQARTRSLDTEESPHPGENEERRKVLRGFKVEYVFDVGQTSGKPVPEPVRPKLLEGEAPPGLGLAVMNLIEERGFKVDTVADAAAIGGANGQTDWVARTVVVRADMDDAAMVKSLLHETAHVLMHEGPPGKFLPRPLKEVEAESVAYVVAAAHSMSTNEYSFPYVGTWAGEDSARAIQATQARVGQAAKAIIEASPAPHELGGKVPGVEAALALARQLKAEAANRHLELAGRSTAADAGPVVA